MIFWKVEVEAGTFDPEVRVFDTRRDALAHKDEVLGDNDPDTTTVTVWRVDAPVNAETVKLLLEGNGGYADDLSYEVY